MTRRRALGRVTAAAVTTLLVAGCGQPATRTVPLNVSVPTSSNTADPTPSLGPVTPGKSSNGTTQLIAVDGNVQRKYRVHVPITAPAGPRPLVVVLHSGGSQPQTVQYNIGLDTVADRLGLYVAYPEAVGGRWNDHRKKSVKSSGGVNDVHFIAAVIRDMRLRQPIDLKRVFVIGHGDGGIMAACFAAARPAAVAGIGLISAQLADGTGCTPPKKRISVVIVHGTADPLFPSAGSVKDGVRSLPATVNYFRSLDRLSGRGVHRQLPDRDPHDGTRVSKTVWGDPKHYMVESYTVTNGGHPWPGAESSPRSLVRYGRTSRDLDTSALVGHFALDVRR
jgi:polyhydroxybutyrate depolymerase